MTSSPVQSQPLAGRAPGAVPALVVGIAGAIAVLVLLAVGVTFVGLAIAFPIAIPLAEAYHLPVSAHDAALAQGFASVWWTFAALAFASFAAAGVTVVKLIGFLSPVPRD